MDEEYQKPKISLWRYFDIFLCFLVGFVFLPIEMLCHYYTYLSGFAIIMLFVILSQKRWYYVDSSQTKKTVRTIIRTVIYEIVIIATFLPFTMNLPFKWYYPIAKALFLSNYSDSTFFDTFLPDNIPENAEHYSVQFMPSVMQASGTINIRYDTDSQTIADYRSVAKRYGAEHFQREILKNDDFEHKWFNIIEHDGTSTDNADVYIFYSNHRNTAVWMLNQQTGYFRAYW